MLEKEKEALEKEKQALLRTSQEILDQEHPLLFDPNDPKVRELEEWDHSSMNRSVLVEVMQITSAYYW